TAKKGTCAKYTPELRSFALTLNFYLSSAYQDVRRIFGIKSLPHPRIISKWYRCIDGSPGYSLQALNAINKKVQLKEQKSKKFVAGLIFDEMSITGSRHVGYINFGTGLQESDILLKAINVLVFMVVGYNCRWKVPVAYFLINSLSGEEKAKLVKDCLQHCGTTGISIKSLTFDGCASNIAMCHLMGANLHFRNIKPYFLISRNALGDWGHLQHGEVKIIKWALFGKLVKLQNESGLHCATRIRSRHIQYSKEKMKLKLAVQIFSLSVADALEYCDKDLLIPAFQESEGTVEFCKNINNIFDLLNTRNAFGKRSYKRPLFKRSENFCKKYVVHFVNYLSSLKGPNGENMLYRSRVETFVPIRHSGNCLAQDNTSILNITVNYKKHTLDSLEENVDISEEIDNDSFISNLDNITNCIYLNDVTQYIAGFVSRKLVRNINCNGCSKDLFVCLVAESITRKHQTLQLLTQLNIEQLFTSLTEHCLEQDHLDGDILQLMRLILKYYFTIRINHVNAPNNKISKRIRQKLTKVIIFKHESFVFLILHPIL
ncbi:hypothetical protein YQE_05015, partial [Dendroctonus ponderosae]